MAPLIGSSEGMQGVLYDVACVANSRAPVLIVGETGVGKDLVARAIHAQSTRAERPYVTVDCGTLSDDLAPSELFGYRRGAFTGATGDTMGLLAAAHQGTLFLDEVGNLSLRTQGALLRALQSRSIRRVGAVREEPLDVRILSATNQELHHASQIGTFRLDLYYRLNTFCITVPPLRDRLTDIPALAEHIVEELNQEYQRSVQLTPEAIVKLQHHDYPGNIRELEHLLHRAYVYCRDHRLRPEHLQPTSVHRQLTTPIPVDNFWQDVATPFASRQLTRIQVQTTLHEGLTYTRGSYRKLAKHFGLPDHDYKRFMDYLRRHQLNANYRNYRGKNA